MDRKSMLLDLMIIVRNDARWVERAEALDDYMEDEEIKAWVRELLDIAKRHNINTNAQFKLYFNSKDDEALMMDLENIIREELSERLIL